MIQQIEKIGYLDFISHIDKELFDNVINKLVKIKALSISYAHGKKIIINPFGEWVINANLDVTLGKIVYDLYNKKI